MSVKRDFITFPPHPRPPVRQTTEGQEEIKMNEPLVLLLRRMGALCQCHLREMLDGKKIGRIDPPPPAAVPANITRWGLVSHT